MPPPLPAAVEPPRTYSGFFRVVGNQPQFQPCGTGKPLDVYGSLAFMRRLTERVRFTGIWEGAKLYAQMQGLVVTDTVHDVGAAVDSVKPGPRTRFNFYALDSLRPWTSSDCGGMRVS